jgi:hypothetical protein
MWERPRPLPHAQIQSVIPLRANLRLQARVPALARQRGAIRLGRLAQDKLRAKSEAETADANEPGMQRPPPSASAWTPPAVPVLVRLSKGVTPAAQRAGELTVTGPEV